MDKITKSLLETFAGQHEIERFDEATQFEHFANYSIISKLNRTSFELEEIHTGGKGGDCAIDGLCLVINGKIVTTIDELDEVVEGPGYLDAEIIFIQSKTSSSFSGSDIGAFICGVKDFLSDKPQLVQNEKVKKLHSLWDKVIEKSNYMINRLPYCKLFYVCTGRWLADQNLQAVMSSGKRELEGFGIFENVTIAAYGANEIQKLYHETKNKLSTTITVQNRITLPDIDGVQEAYLGIVPFQEFIKLIQDENQTIHSIFDDNVRDFQGENAVNKRIKDTLNARKFDLFCVLNNGVTVVASSLTTAGNRFTLRDYQIVNGCQTSNVLHECQNLAGVDRVSVPIKIIITESDDIKTEITLATNSQTEVKTEQLEALSIFQKHLEMYFNAEKGGIRLYYERRSQQYNSLAGVKRTQIVSIPIQIKSFASIFLASPHLVSGYYGTIVKRFKGQIFGSDHRFLPYYVSALCYYRIEQFFRSGDLSPDFKKARFHLMMIVKMIVMGCKNEALNSKKIDVKCEEFKNLLLDDYQAVTVFQQAATIFSSCGIDMTKKQYKSETETDQLLKAVELRNSTGYEVVVPN